MLLGRDFQEQNKADMSIWRKEVRIGSGRTELLDSSAGHPSVDLRPQLWKSLKETQDYVRAGDDLPRALRPRARSGPPKPQRLLPEKKKKSSSASTGRLGAFFAAMFLSAATAPCAEAAPCEAEGAVE